MTSERKSPGWYLCPMPSGEPVFKLPVARWLGAILLRVAGQIRLDRLIHWTVLPWSIVYDPVTGTWLTEEELIESRKDFLDARP